MSFGKNRFSLTLIASLLLFTGFTFALPSVRAALGLAPKATSQTQELAPLPLNTPKLQGSRAPRLMASAPAFAPTTVVGWTSFSDWVNRTAEQGITGNVGVSTLTTVGAGAVTFSDAYGTGSTWAFANSWDGGANTKAWRFSFSTLNCTAMTFSCKMAGTTNFSNFMGPRDFKLQYSLNGTTWTDVSGGTLQAGTANASTINFTTLSNVSLPVACENQTTVYLQMLMTSNTGANGSSSVNGGQSHIDDIVVTGTVATPSPTITSATYNANTGALAVTASDMTTGDTIDVSKLTLTGEGGSTYTLTTSNVTASSATAFSVTLNATDKAAVNQILNKTGTSSTSSTTYNLAAATNWDSTASAAADTTNGITVSNVAVPTITSATYDATSGVLTATGTGFLKLSGATNDIVANKLTFTGQGAATYTLTDSANVEITSGTAFSLTLSSTDKTAVSALLNKNGTSSNDATTYNLAAAEDWAAGAASAVVVADLTGNGITVSNVPAPAPTLGNYATTTVTAGGSTTVTPTAAPTNTTSATASAPGFTGLLLVNPTTGVVTINNAQPAGSYTVTVKAFGAGGSATKTFTLTVSNPVACTTPGFSGTTNVGVGAAPFGVAVGDFNGDGNLDFAAANLTSNAVSIRLGDGAGGFSGTTEVSTGTAPRSVAVGDFNGDGKLDFAVANNTNNTVSIRLGDGAGSFSGTTEVSVGSGPYSVAAGDFNGDGNLDFAAANNTSNTVSIRLGDGAGGFSGTTNVSVGSNPRSAAVGDFNGDGKLDFAAANHSGNTVSIRLGDGAGGFSGTTNVSVGSNPIGVAVGDFNGDGKLDFAAANYGSTTVSIRLGDGAGGFSGTTDASVGGLPHSVAVGDFNGDGNLDFAAPSYNSTTVSIRLGDGAGNFSGTTNVSVGNNSRSVAIGDFNGDGKLDFAAANSGSDTVSIRLNSCTNNTAPTITAGSTLARTQGATASNATIATVNDTETAAGSLTVTATTVPTGITVTNISNSGGTITADVAAGCTATAGANTVVLTVTDGGALTATANLTVNVASGAASISTPPSTQTVTAGGSVTFSVTASNATGYQWRKGGNPINGATASSYTINPVSTGDADSYDVVVTGVCGNATSTAATLTVNKASQTITFGTLAAKTWGDAAFTVGATASSNLAVSYSIVSGPATINGNTVTLTGIGTVTIRASQAGNTEYNAATDVDQSFTVNKATLTVTAADKTKVYGEANPALTYSYSGFVNGETASVLTGTPSVTTSATTASGVGGHTITAAAGTLSASNYQFSFVNGTLTVTNAALTVTAANQTRVYGAANPTLTFSYSGFVNGDTVSILTGTPAVTTTATATSNVGNHAITVAQGTLSVSNYALQFVDGTLTITKAPLSVTTVDATRVYGQANPAFSGALQGVLNNDAITASWNSAAGPSSNVGPYAITPALNDPNNRAGNYEVTLTPGTLTVTKATLTVTAENKERAYGAANPSLTGQLTGQQNNDGITATWSTTATLTTPVGTYPITASLNDPNNRSSNYDVQFVNGTLTIGKATLTVTAADKTKVYGEANPTLTYNYSGWLNGDTEASLTGSPRLATSANSRSHVGTYDITVLAGTLSAANYTLNFVGGKLTVTPAPLTVTADSHSRSYGTANPAFTATFNGLVNDDTMNLTAGTATLTTSALPNSPVGQYQIVPSGINNSDYNVTYVPGILTITSVPAALNVAASLTPSALGQSVTFTVSAQATTPFGGMPGGPMVFLVDGKNPKPFVLNAAGQASITLATLEVGTHTILASYSGDNNYQAGTKEFTQEVTKATSYVTLTTLANPISTGQQPTLTAKVRGTGSQPQGEVEFFVDGKSVGRVPLTNGVATFALPEMAAGEHSVQAVYLGDATAASSSATMTQHVTEDCVYVLSQKEVMVEPKGGKVVVELTTRTYCPWTVGEQPTWVEVQNPEYLNGKWVITMNVAAHTEPTARVAKIRIGDQYLTITQSRPMAAVQAATYDPQTLAGDAIASIFGTDLASSTASANTQPLPTQLGGVRVKLRDRTGKESWASLLYASSTQINFVVPAGLAEGDVIATVVRDEVEVSASKFALETVAPGLFSADSSGNGPAAAQVQRVRPDGSQSLTDASLYNSASKQYEPQPIILNTSTSLTSDDVYLVLYGTGLRNRTSLQNVRARIGNQDAQVVYAGAQPQYAGLDQINILIPQSLTGAGLVDVVLTIDGRSSNTVKIFIQ